MKQALILFFVFLSFGLQAQKTFSIGLDADNDQFFSVAIGKKTYASSSIGHLLITGLKDSTYQLNISFPRSNYLPESFTITIDKKDHKFLLKKIGEKQWNLQDIQTNTWLKQKSGTPQLSAPVDEAGLARSRDAFKKLMAAVVNDTAILSTEIETPPVPKKEILVKNDPPREKLKEKKDSVSELNQNSTDSLAIVKHSPEPKAIDTIEKKVNSQSDIAKEEIKPLEKDSAVIEKPGTAVAQVRIGTSDSAKSKEAIKVPEPVVIETVTKLYEINKVDKKELVFLTKDSSGKRDTVDIVIPFEKEPEQIPPPEEIKKAGVPVDQKMADTVIIEKKISPVVKPDTVTRKITIINSDCRNFATEADLDKLRVKMISENRMEERIVVAKKVFKTKCFTTRQIRALTELFVSDKTRYEFFDAAYPFVSDTANFKSLLDLLTDEYYVGRFKAMVRIAGSW